MSFASSDSEQEATLLFGPRSEWIQLAQLRSAPELADHLPVP